MRGGDIVFNLQTGQFKLVIGYDPASNQVTFSGEEKWRDARPWKTHLRPDFSSPPPKKKK